MPAAPEGWPMDPDGVAYPPEPWHLRGSACVSLWRVPAAAVPAGHLPPGARIATPLGRALVGTAWAVHGPGGVLAYNEVMAAVRVRVAGRAGVTVTHVWVDHPSSVAGGRELWAIPKQLAAFRVRDVGAAGFAASASEPDGRPLAEIGFRAAPALPGRWRLRTATAQRPLGPGGDGAGARVAEAEVRASVAFGAATWTFAPDGPLGFLAGRRPFLSVRLSDASLRFGGEAHPGGSGPRSR